METPEAAGKMDARMDASKRRRRPIARIAALVLVLGGTAWFLHSRDADDEPGIHVHPGIRTTWLDGPLRPDGTVDYREYVRRERQRGVTKENDLAPILSLCLEKPLRDVPPATDRERPPAPAVSWSSWSTDHEIGDSDDPDAEQVWLSGRVDGPHADEIRKWLAAIGPALDLIQREARVRDHWFEPPDPIYLVGAQLTSELRTIVPCFVMRAVGRDVDGDRAGAVEDLRTVFDLIGRRRGWDGLVGFLSILACEGYVAEPLAALAERNATWTCVDFRRVDAALPREPREEQLAGFLPWERLEMLHMVVESALDPTALERAEKAMQAVEQRARAAVHGESGGPPPADLESMLAPSGRHDAAMPARILDRLLELVNEGFDTRSAALVEGDWEKRVETLRDLQRQSMETRRRWIFHWDFWRKLTASEEEARDPEAAARVIADLAIPLFGSVVKTTVTATVASDASRLRFALACFKNEHGRLPRDVAELTAACFDAPPRDRLYGEPLGWTVGADGSLEVTSRGAPLSARLNAKPRR